MKGIILAAGEGKRLRPLTNDVPKAMVDFCGLTLLERQINTMRNCKVDDIIVVTGYKSDKINIPGIDYVQNKKFNSTNMLESLFCAEKKLEGDLIISYADIIYEQTVLQQLSNSEEQITVVIDKKWQSYWEKRFDDPLIDSESLKINSRGNITDIGQKVSNIANIQGQYIGLMKFNSVGVKILKDFYNKCKNKSKLGRNVLNPNIPFEKSYMTDLLQGLIKSHIELKALIINGGWLEFDSFDDYNLYQKMISENTLNQLINLDR